MPIFSISSLYFLERGGTNLTVFALSTPKGKLEITLLA